MSDQEVPVIAVPGGPLSGKDGCKPFIVQKFGDLGYLPFYTTESATLHMSSNLKPSNLPLKTFQRGVILTTVHLEDAAKRAAFESNHPLPLVLCNRGVPDCEPYSPNGLYEEILSEVNLDPIEARDRRYKAAIFLRSLAYDRPDLYDQLKHNNPHRLEDVDQARVMDEATLKAWVGHPHLRVIDNSTDWAGKLKRIEQEICAVLGIPVPIEDERKFLCAPVDFASLPVFAQKIDIDQAYLFSADPKATPRVRQRGQYGKYVYFHTVKKEIVVGKNIEYEKFITADQYRWSLDFILPNTRIVKKHRHCFVYENQYFELDCIPLGNHIVYLLEIELTDRAQKLVLPPFLNIEREVTSDRNYTNRAFANLAWRP